MIDRRPTVSMMGIGTVKDGRSAYHDKQHVFSQLTHGTQPEESGANTSEDLCELRVELQMLGVSESARIRAKHQQPTPRESVKMIGASAGEYDQPSPFDSVRRSREGR